MTDINRVLLGEDNSGVFRGRVSKPGVDVLSASAGQLLFDAQYETMSVFMEGSISAAKGVITSFYFGTTFAYKPLVLMQQQDTTGTANTPFFWASYPSGASRYNGWLAQVYTDRVDFINYDYGGRTLAHAITVLQYNTG